MKSKVYYILPSYNEALNIPTLLNSINTFYKKKKISIIVVIINDGSSDNTLSVIQKSKKKFQNKLK